MIVLAVLVLAWAVARACIQSITMDEAATYLAWVAPEVPNYWTPHSNNHLLNSFLIRMTTTVFGVSQISVRLPALFGAALYVLSCALLCRRIFEGKPLRLLVFACLVLNPYVADFYAAARGYSMALGFLMAAISAVIVWSAWLPASVFLGLAFLANFPFAFICAGVWASLMWWSGFGWRSLLKSTLPGIIMVAVLGSWTLVHWPTGQLFDGARSLGETFQTIVSGGLYEPSPEIANPQLLAFANWIRPLLAPTLVGLALLQAALALRQRRRHLAFIFFAAPLVALSMHYLGHVSFGMLLPRNRTAIYLIPFATLAAGTAATLQVHTRRVSVALLALLVFYYLLCLRVNHFYEWWANSDAKHAYYVLAHYSRNYKITDVPTRTPLAEIFEFYRRASGNETFMAFRDGGPLQPGKDLYGFYELQDPDLITRGRLKVVYRGKVTVAVRTGLEVGDLRISGGTFDDTDRRVQYHGRWTADMQFPQAENGSISYSNQPGDWFEIRFSGTSIRYVYTKAANRGTADVYIDGRLVRKLNLYSASTRWRSSTVFSGLSEGEHVFRVQVGKPSHRKATGTFVDVDLLVTPTGSVAASSFGNH